MIRVLLATGRPSLDAAIAAEPDLDIVAQAYYAEAAVTALDELQPDVAVIDSALPGAGSAVWTGDAPSQTTKVVWLDRPDPSRPPGPRWTGGDHADATSDPRSIVVTIRSLMTEGGSGAASAVAGTFASTGTHAFLGCLPRLGVTTAAVAFATAAARARARVAIVDANLRHPCVPELLGLTPPSAGWNTAERPEDLAGTSVRAHGIACWPLSPGTWCEGPGTGGYARMKWVVPALDGLGYSVIVVDLGAPSPLEHGRLAGWLEWLVSTRARANLVIAQDPQALLAAARVLRTGEAAGAAIDVWCASYDERISSISDVSAALGTPCRPLPWDRHTVVSNALVGRPPSICPPQTTAPRPPGRARGGYPAAAPGAGGSATSLRA